MVTKSIVKRAALTLNTYQSGAEGERGLGDLAWPAETGWIGDSCSAVALSTLWSVALELLGGYCAQVGLNPNRIFRSVS